MWAESLFFAISEHPRLMTCVIKLTTSNQNKWRSKIDEKYNEYDLNEQQSVNLTNQRIASGHLSFGG